MYSKFKQLKQAWLSVMFVNNKFHTTDEEVREDLTGYHDIRGNNRFNAKWIKNNLRWLERS